ncbi:MAG: inner membrane CreD family protein [Verrucomicrobia bacterium]|nr:inner membrane CreD family protein [Verrucomicrobiota bacterium]MDA1085424.1 inner membrane CreD family protein [Verrucomicrobiota bacterium]
MSIKRIIAVGFIFLLACAGWMILGTSTTVRSSGFATRLGLLVGELWGESLTQPAPSFGVTIPGSEQVRWLVAERNEISVALETDYRKKGLIWYPTYKCTFDGAYTIVNTEEVAQKIRLRFAFPKAGGTYNGFSAAIDDQPLQMPITSASELGEIIELEPGEEKTFRVTYKTRGMTDWRYVPDPNVGRVRNLTLDVTTNFEKVDYTERSLSPESADLNGGKAHLVWAASDLITTQEMGVIIPERLNPGPVASRITFFAPVCLIFFFVLIATINIMYKIPIHPMHYMFVAAGFFAFHLLLAYMVDLIPIHVSFVISAIVSVALVTSYLATALGREFPWKVAAGGQILFLVLFSYSFFLKGTTGLTVAIGSVVTLGVLMRVTARVDWYGFFEKSPAAKPAEHNPEPPPLPAISNA